MYIRGIGKWEGEQPEQAFSREVVMFSKETDKLESFLGRNSSFKGKLNVRGTLRVEGVVEGQLDVDHVILSQSAEVKGEINAKKITIGGKMDGKVCAQELVEINSKGKVLGDIFTSKLSIIEGAEFNGMVEMKKEESKIIELGVKGREMAKL